MSKASVILEKFRAHFGTDAVVCRAPGRVNLIGEHTDYNEGFVLPVAIDFYCWVAVGSRRDGKLVVYSENFQEGADAELGNLWAQKKGSWTDYPFGVAWALKEAGHKLAGANIYITGEVPLGSGLSSSAAIEIAVGYALLRASDQVIDRNALALNCQRAENEFVGARCGIMDQFVSSNGQQGHALMIDCRSLDYQAIRLPPQIRLVVCNTMVKHEHSAGGYNARRSECEEGVRRLAAVLPGMRALRDVTAEQLEQHRSLLPEVVYRRCRHVISENNRVLCMVEALKRGDVREIPQLMRESHESLRDDFEVSCRELDLMVEIASAKRGVLGARITGGGFGGCTINLIESSAAKEFQERVGAEYEATSGLRPDILICEPSQGVETADLNGSEDRSALLQQNHGEA
jgi:galactokinase